MEICMRKNLIVYVCLFLITVPIFGQAINKAEYKAIDPFDYKQDEDRVRRGNIRQFKSVVEFVSEQKGDITTFYEFISLDKRTPLRLIPNPDSNLKPPSPGQTVTVYYTVRKLSNEDNRVLDMFEDNRNKDEKGLGVEKSPIPSTSPNVRKSDYEKISTDEYTDNAFFTQEGDDERKFFAILQFVAQEGILFQFSNPENSGEKTAFLFMKVKRRYPVFTAGQKMTVYFTASKEYKDFLRLDDIVVMN
jgi:hypothetical protein